MMDKMEWQRLKENCPYAPWCQDDPEDIATAVTSLMRDQEPFVKQWSYKWYENMQFVFGNHHLKWSRRLGVAVDVDFLRPQQRAVNQKSYTNISRVCAESLGSLIYSQTPKWEVNPTDESSTQSTRWAKVIQALLDAQIELQELHNDFRVAANSFVTFGQLGAVIDWDYNQGDTIKIPRYQKVQTNVYRSGLRPEPLLGGIMDSVRPALGSNGMPMQSNGWEVMTDEMGMPIMVDVPLGRPRVTFLTPFEYRREPGSSGIHSAKWIQRIRLIEFDDWIREYGNLEGKTRFYPKVVPENMNKIVQHFALMQFLRLHMVAPIADDFWRQAGYSFSEYLRRKVLVIEHWDRPTPRWPNGRRSVIANGHCTHVTEPQFKTNKVGGWHPFVEASWFSIMPSPMSAGPLHDVVAKNKQLNTTDSLIATALLRNFGSHLLVKAGGGLDPDKITGTPGEIHEVADPETVARWLHDNNPIPPVLNQIREGYKDDTYDVSGAGDALRGQRTVGVSSGYAYRIMQEREERRLTPAKKEWQRMIGIIGEKVTACMKANCIQLDQNVVGYLKSQAAGKFTMQDVVSFIATPLNFGIDVNVVDGSMEMKSKASSQANLMDLQKNTPLGRRLEADANVMDKFLKHFDAEELRDLSAAHRDRAQRENEVFSDMLALGPQGKAGDMPIVWAPDDHHIHMAAHSDWMIKNDYELSKNPWLFEAVTLHIEQHRVQMRELKGEVPPGTSDIVPQLAQATQHQPSIQGVIQEKAQMAATQVQQATPQGQTAPPQGQPQQQKPQQGPKAPGGPTQPAPVGSKGPPQQSTATPAANTPTGRGQI
jgi:hypothetical protein